MVKNKTIIGLKFQQSYWTVRNQKVKNKTIIGLKYQQAHIYILLRCKLKIRL